MVTIDSICQKMAEFQWDFDPYGFLNACADIGIDENNTIEGKLNEFKRNISEGFKRKQYRRNVYQYYRDIAEESADDDQETFNKAVEIIMDLIEYERRYA